jgi:hypothetical protein
MNPLWVVSLFLALAEVTIGAVATQLSGWIQGVLAIFCVVFPSGIAAAFFFVVWHKPYVLYAPRDYTKGTNVSTFVEAMTISRTNQNRAVEEAVRATAETVVQKYLTGLGPQPVTADVSEVIDEARANFERIHVYVDSSDVATKYGQSIPSDLRIPAFDEMTMQEFLDELWSRLYPAFEPYTYGDQWILEDIQTKNQYTTVQAPARSRDRGDNRDLRTVGIEAGDCLRIVLLASAPESALG